MGLSMQALAKAHGVSAAASNKAVEAVKSVGFSTEAAIHAVDRLMISDMKLSKAQGLAKVAKDAAAIENITPGEALEKLLMAIESGASRGLRTMGIFVDLNKEVQRQELLTGKTLDENEVRQLRYNAVMREAAKIQGAAAAASGSAEAQSAALAREVNELKEAIGEQFQGYLRSWVGHLRDLVGFLKENSDWLVKFAQRRGGGRRHPRHLWPRDEDPGDRSRRQRTDRRAHGESLGVAADRRCRHRRHRLEQVADHEGRPGSRL